MITTQRTDPQTWLDAIGVIPLTRGMLVVDVFDMSIEGQRTCGVVVEHMGRLAIKWEADSELDFAMEDCRADLGDDDGFCSGLRLLISRDGGWAALAKAHADPTSRTRCSSVHYVPWVTGRLMGEIKIANQDRIAVAAALTEVFQ